MPPRCIVPTRRAFTCDTMHNSATKKPRRRHAASGAVLEGKRKGEPLPAQASRFRGRTAVT